MIWYGVGSLVQVLSRPTGWPLDVVGQIQGYIEWYWYGTLVVSSLQSAVQVLIVGCWLIVGLVWLLDIIWLIVGCLVGRVIDLG